MTKQTVCVSLLVTIVAAPLSAQSYQKQDTAIGGLAGAVIGGIIGHQNDETPEGALIGGAVGAIAGNILGANKDTDVRRREYYRSQAQYHHQAWQKKQVSRAVAINDVVQMSRSGLSDSLILNHIQQNGVVSHIGTREIIAMHEQGVSEQVITAMQNAPRPSEVSPSPPPPPRRRSSPPQVIVEREVHVVRPPVYYRPPHRVRYATRPAFPAYPSRVGFYSVW